MAPRSAWNKKVTTSQNVPKPANQEQIPLPAADYGTVQLEEIEALRAIYMDDFEDVVTKNAWSKTTDHAFKLRLAAFSDIDGHVTLLVKLTATYPKTAPLLEISGLESFHERTQKRIRNVLQSRPKQMLGEVMVHSIAAEIQEILEDAVQARQNGTLPSLEDERASAEEVAAALAMQAKEVEARRQLEQQEEEDRVLKQMVDEEIHRREKRKVPKPVANTTEKTSGAPAEIVTFDRSSTMIVGKESAEFATVAIVGESYDYLIGKPIVNATSPTELVAIVKRKILGKSRQEMAELETALDRVRTLRHASILTLYSFRIDKDGNSSLLTLCSETVSKGSLEDLLRLCTNLQAPKARQFTIELLEALEECHRQGIYHGNVNTKTVLLSNNPSANLKLSEIAYGRILTPKEDLPHKWRPPESGDSLSNALWRKSDIWMLGVVVLQMFLGLGVTTHSSPQATCDRLHLSDSFEDLIRRMCHSDPRKRPSAFDLLAAEFLRTDASALEDDGGSDERLSLSRIRSPISRRSRHNSSNMMERTSRYAQDFTEIGRLGKGGFGEVVKARNKLDGGIYAIKKISRAPQLDQILSEVMLLNRLNHPYVVRYFSTWVEETVETGSEEAVSTTDETISDGPRMDFGYQSTGGLDFVSSSGYPQIEFGIDSDSEQSTDDDSVEDADGPFKEDRTSSPSRLQSSLRLKKSRSDSRKVLSTLYIQMEYCERHTLRDLVRKGMNEEDSWRYARQITEGLSHIHSHGIIHRDLKPDNIFIDVAGNPKIGDFGLATTGQYQIPERGHMMSGQTSVDMTRSVGTALYVAPELSSGSGTSYNDKVDMYSLGIMFYEMCEPFTTAMERIRALQDIRKKDHELPQAFQQSGPQSKQGKLIACLVSHKPSERPSSTELLRTGMLPVMIEDETIRQALSGLSDPRSPYHQKMMSALFAHDQTGDFRVKSLAWDAKDQTTMEEPIKLRLRAVAKDTMSAIFRRHGAEEVQREPIFPRSSYYNAPNVVQLLDASGNLLQMSYDLTLPQARRLARHHLSTRSSFTFGLVYRDTFSGGPPSVNEEVDFDIVAEPDSTNLAFDDAEIFKVLDEIVGDSTLMAGYGEVNFRLNHSFILDAVLDFCNVPTPQQAAVKECISKLGYRQFTWAKVRAELRSHALGLSTTMVDDLEQFDFREEPERAFTRLRDLLQNGSERTRTKLDVAARHLQDVLGNTSRLGVTRKIWISPLASFNPKFYESGILLQCVHERKTSRDVLAAGGRYDSLIRACKGSGMAVPVQGAVGISIGLDRLVATMLKTVKSTTKATFAKDSPRQQNLPKRCDVLLVAGSSETLQPTSMKLLASLWDNQLAAEMAMDDHPVHEDQYDFVVTLRHEASTTVKVRGTADDAIESDVPIATLVSHLKQELREKEGSKRRQMLPERHPSQAGLERKAGVQVLMSQHRSKKSNKYNIVETAQHRWAEKLDQWKEAPILAVETRDDVIETVRETRLGDAESWKKALQNVQPNERQYLQQIQDILSSWRKKWVEGDAQREACLLNFRTGHAIYYDLGL